MSLPQQALHNYVISSHIVTAGTQPNALIDANRSIQSLLRAVLFEAESVEHMTTNGLRGYKANHWPKLLPYAVASFNAHAIAGTNISAFQMKHGYEFRTRGFSDAKDDPGQSLHV